MFPQTPPFINTVVKDLTVFYNSGMYSHISTMAEENIINYALEAELFGD